MTTKYQLINTFDYRNSSSSKDVYVIHAQLGLLFVEMRLLESYGQDIHHLLGSRCVDEWNNLAFNLLTDELSINLHMLSAITRNWVLDYAYGCLVVTRKIYWIAVFDFSSSSNLLSHIPSQIPCAVVLYSALVLLQDDTGFFLLC